MRDKKGFTLIELLVVIAIIAMLLAILVPSLQTAKEMAQGTVCMAHLRGLSMSFYLYAEDNDSKLARADQGTDRWVDRPHDNLDAALRTYTNHGSTVEEKELGIMTGTLYPYNESTKLYHCAGDRRTKINNTAGGKGPYRSFAMPGALGSWPDDVYITSIETGATFTFHPVNKYSEFVSPGDKYIFVEEMYTHGPGMNTETELPNKGYNNGVWSFWSNDQYERWWDPLAPWHNDRTNLGYADGHAQKLVWKDERTVKFAYNREHPDLGGDPRYQPGNPDQAYMSRAYPCRR